MMLALLALLTAILAACGSANSPATANILGGDMQSTTFAEVKQSVDNLYSHHPDITAFAVKDVSYTPATRDKVLTVCRDGSVAATPGERERQKVLACAPLIFFYYSYGWQSSVPESVAVARQLYRYAMTDNAAEATKVLTDLLRSWGVQ
jgi:hypothetical protein